MLRRLTTAVVLAIAVFIAGCSDQPARVTGPEQAPSLTINVNDIRALIIALVPNQPYQGQAQRAFAAIESAINGGGTGETEALEFQQLIVGFLNDGLLQLPTGFETIDEAAVNLLNTVFRYAGLLHLLHPEAPVDDNVEYAIEIVTESDYKGPVGLEKALVKTNFGNAALTIPKGDISIPAFAAIIENSNYQFPVPEDVRLIGKVFDYSLSSEIKKIVDGGGTVLSICDAVSQHTGAIVLLHDTGDEFAKAIPANPAVTGHACGVAPNQASALRGGSFWARGLNAAGSLMQSVLLPKPAYATHSLAHAIIVDDLSPWSIGELLDKFTVKIARVKTPGFKTTDFHAVFPKQGNLVLWLEISNHGVVQTCDGGRQLTDVQARPTATSGSGSPTVGTWTSATRCEIVDGTSGWVIEMPNPRNNKVSSGVIDVRVTGQLATPQLTYEAKL